MNKVEINQDNAQKLFELSQQTDKSVDELLEILLNNYRQILIADQVDDDDVSWSDEEIAKMLETEEPLTGKEIASQGLLGGWKDMGIEDSLDWLKQQRAKRGRKFQW